MKLHREIMHAQLVQKTLAEATGPIPYECILDGIVQKGKSGADLDDYEVFVVANLIWFFSSGRTNTNTQMDGLVNIDSNATTVEATAMVRAIPKDEMVKIATELQYLIKIGNNYVPAGGSLNSMPPNEWMAYVLKRQD